MAVDPGRVQACTMQPWLWIQAGSRHAPCSHHREPRQGPGIHQAAMAVDPGKVQACTMQPWLWIQQGPGMHHAAITVNPGRVQAYIRQPWLWTQAGSRHAPCSHGCEPRQGPGMHHAANGCGPRQGPGIQQLWIDTQAWSRQTPGRPHAYNS